MPFSVHLFTCDNIAYIPPQVVKGGAADKAGLEEDDVLVEVNGVNMESGTHEVVVDMIRKTGDTLVLLVAGRTAYDHLKATGVAITPALLGLEATRPPSPPSPKLPEVGRSAAV